MRINDRMVSVIEAKADIPNLIRGWFPEWMGDGNILCPFHNDTNASLHISPDGKAKCYGCDFHARNIVHLFAKMQGVPYDQARKDLYEMVVKAVPMQMVGRMAANLTVERKAYNYLLYKRNLRRTLIQYYQLGLDPHTKRISIPIYDQFMTPVNIRLIAGPWMKETKNKAINLKGHGEIRLYPEWQLIHESKILLVEGEFDCLCARGYSIPAVTWTGGAGGFSKDHIGLLADKTVFLLYDNDEAGEEGKWLMVEKLRGVAREVKVIDPLASEGKDLTDWSFSHEDKVVRLSEYIKSYTVTKEKIQHMCPTCGRPM